MKNGLFHKELGMPKGAAESILRTWDINMSARARKAQREDRYGYILMPSKLTFNAGQVIEVEIRNARVVKAVVRIPHCTKYDLVVVFCPDFESAFVKTVWLNDNEDKHSTLKKELYSRP